MNINSEVVEPTEPADLSPVAASMFAVIVRGSKAVAPIGSEARRSRLTRVTEAGAWTEAALALVELELPRWHVRRLELDGDEWYCTLSRYLQAPHEFDDAIDGRGPSLPLAILDALLEGHRRSLNEANTQPPASSEPTRTEVVWCENVR